MYKFMSKETAGEGQNVVMRFAFLPRQLRATERYFSLSLSNKIIDSLWCPHALPLTNTLHYLYIFLCFLSIYLGFVLSVFIEIFWFECVWVDCNGIWYGYEPWSSYFFACLFVFLKFELPTSRKENGSSFITT